MQGKPLTLKAGARAGDYIWHDSTGWHLRVTHPGSAKVIFTGRIVSSAPMTFKPARLERGDTITLSADKKTLTYKFYNYGKVDGVDFKTACAQRLRSPPRSTAASSRRAGSGSAARAASAREPLRGHQDRLTETRPGDTTAAVGDDRRRPMSARVVGVRRWRAAAAARAGRRVASDRLEAVLGDERLGVELAAPQHEPDRGHRDVADVREAVRDRRVDRDRVTGPRTNSSKPIRTWSEPVRT